MNRSLSKLFSLITILALMMMALPMQSAGAATPTELFFSEYIEGSSFNKAVEIYNGTGAPVDLSTYTVELYSNGAAVPSQSVALSGTLTNGDVFVIAHGSAAAAILTVADMTSSTVINFNGDDAVVLRNNGAVVDAFGQVGVDPGTEWTGGGVDDTLRRNTTVCAGDTNPGDTFNASVEWTSFAVNTFDGLGVHTANCDTDILSLTINDVSANEGNSDFTNFTFTVSLSAPAGPDNVTFDFTTADGTATAVSDYAPSAGNDVIIAAGDSTYTITVQVYGDTTGEPNETFFVNITDVTGATVADGQGQGTIINDDVVVTPIHDIQGSGDTSTAGTFTVEAIVVGDYQTQGSGQLRGFFLQEEDADADADPATSEGIFVFCSSCPTAVSVGDKVRVTGGANDFIGMSQLSATSAGSVNVLSSGNPLPTPASIDLPASGSTRAELTFENIEGMLVIFTDTLYVSEYFELARYGQLVLTADARPSQFTDANEPDVPGYADFLDDLNKKRIYLDDDNNIQNDALGGTPAQDEPYFWPRPGLSNTNLIRGGDSITNLTGVLHWSWAGFGANAWRVRPVEPAFNYAFTSNNERPSEPEDVGDSLKVASFNVLNYFTSINSRGADSVTELDRQREKTAAAVCAIDADIAGLIEIENNAGVAINDLLNGAGGINANCGPYDYIDTGVLGTDEIIQAFIYKPASVSPVGDFAVLDSSLDPRFDEDLNRPALAQTFQDNTTGGIFTVVVNHLKSKGDSGLGGTNGICTLQGPGADVDCDQGDGQGFWNYARTQAALALVDWLASDPTDSGDEDFLIMGDLNSYRNEDPIDTIEAGADDTAATADDYTDLLDSLVGPSAYSYLFDGQLGYLDTGLASGDLLAEVTGVTEWHINADEIPVFDYNDEIDDGSNESSFERESTSLPIYEPNQYRSSDHDPIIVGLDLVATCNGLPATIVGTTGNDTIDGTNGNDVIVGLGGNDIINGGKGDDVICGDGGDDTLNGGDGDDILVGGHGDDILDGGKGDDTLIGRAGNDTLDGGNGDDSLDGGANDDILRGNLGDDTLTGGTGADSFSGGPGTDTNTDFNAGQGDTSDGT